MKMFGWKGLCLLLLLSVLAIPQQLRAQGCGAAISDFYKSELERLYPDRQCWIADKLAAFAAASAADPIVKAFQAGLSSSALYLRTSNSEDGGGPLVALDFLGQTNGVTVTADGFEYVLHQKDTIHASLDDSGVTDQFGRNGMNFLIFPDPEEVQKRLDILTANLRHDTGSGTADALSFRLYNVPQGAHVSILAGYIDPVTKNIVVIDVLGGSQELAYDIEMKANVVLDGTCKGLPSYVAYIPGTAKIPDFWIVNLDIIPGFNTTFNVEGVDMSEVYNQCDNPEQSAAPREPVLPVHP